MQAGAKGGDGGSLRRRLHRGAAVGCFFLAERGIRATGVSVLPPALLGMLLLFAGMLGLERINANAATAFFTSLEPGYRFLVKWAPVFLMPALVKLPLVEGTFTLGVIVRLTLFMLLGFLAQLLAVAFVATRFPEAEEEPLAAAEKGAAAAKAAPQPKGGTPPKRPKLPGFAAVIVFSALAAKVGLAPRIAEAAFMVFVTVFALVAAKTLSPRTQKVAHPIVVTLLSSWAGVAVWAALSGPGVDFHEVLVHYSVGAGAFLSALLGPLVIALAFLLYERRALLRRDFAAIMVTTFFGAAAGVFGSVLLARLLGLPHAMCLASGMRFVTAPLAVVMVALLSAQQAYALAMSIVSGLLGATLGGPVLGLLRLRSSRARGLAVGASSHVLGTMSLASTDESAFPYGAVCFVLVGSMSVILVSVPGAREALLALAA